MKCSNDLIKNSLPNKIIPKSLILILILSTAFESKSAIQTKLADRLKQKSLASENLKNQTRKFKNSLIFDIPVTYNSQVKKWINYFQGTGSRWFRERIERSYKYLPYIQNELVKHDMPKDLAFMVMIESGFSANAESTSDAVGPWQFIESTGKRYGLKINWWIDERRDFKKSTIAAIRYMRDLYNEFGSWYLVAASYNMGENGLRRRIKKYGTNDYWTLLKLNGLPDETKDYVPKMLAAMLITKAPNLYGFRSLEKPSPLKYDLQIVRGGTELNSVADRIGVTRKSIRDLNAELVLGYVPTQVKEHHIRVPQGAGSLVAKMFYNDETTSLYSIE